MLFYKICVLSFYFVISWKVILRVVEECLLCWMFFLHYPHAPVSIACAACSLSYWVCILKNYLNVLILWITETGILLLDTLLLHVDGEKTV